MRHPHLLFCLIIAMIFFVPSSSMAYLSDPTKPKIDTKVRVTKEKATPFNLQSILIGKMRRVAMINDKLVGVGSTVNGARVLGIDRNHVVLLYSGRKTILYLFGKRLWTSH